MNNNPTSTQPNIEAQLRTKIMHLSIMLEVLQEKAETQQNIIDKQQALINCFQELEAARFERITAEKELPMGITDITILPNS